MNFIGTYGLVQGLGNLAPYLLSVVVSPIHPFVRLIRAALSRTLARPSVVYLPVRQYHLFLLIHSLHNTAGVLADKVGIYNTVLVGNVVLCIMFWVWLACKSTASIIILVVVIGLSGGAFIALQPPLATVTCKDMRYGGTMLGQALCEHLVAT